MKQLFTLMALIIFCRTASAQKESDSIRVGNMIILTKGEKKTETKKEELLVKAQPDTIPAGTGDTLHIGNMLIVRDGKNEMTNERKNQWHYWGRRNEKLSNVSTNWCIIDIGFSNYSNQTKDYSSASGYLYNRTGAAPLGENDFNLNVG